MKIDFSGKVALVTGGGSGIGRALCLAFADAGARIACVDIDSARGEQTAALIRERGGEAFYMHADVTDPESVRGYVDATTAAYGRIDAFANNATFPTKRTRESNVHYDRPSRAYGHDDGCAARLPQLRSCAGRASRPVRRLAAQPGNRFVAGCGDSACLENRRRSRMAIYRGDEYGGVPRDA